VCRRLPGPTTKRRAYYFHRFYEFQPDLNTNNPAVQAEILKIMGFWLQLGVAGFRVDAMPFVIASEGAEVRQAGERYNLLRRFRTFLQWRRDDAVMLAEANVPPAESTHYFGEDGDRVHMLFNFPVNQRLFYALATGDTGPLVKALGDTRSRPPTAQWGMFLRNHDELDLGRLTEKQRAAVFAAMGPEPEMQLYGRGMRRRLAPMLCNDRRRLELAYSLLFGLPGTPVLGYGDEIGMGDDLDLPERNCARTPMQWSTEPHGGFTTAANPVLPVIGQGPYGFQHINVAAQRRDPDTLLNWLERIIRMRGEVPEIGWGSYTVIPFERKEVLVIRYEWRGNAVLLVHNFAGEPVDAEIKLEDDGGAADLVNLLSEDHSIADAERKHRIVLEPYGYRWYRIGGLDYLLKRTEC
jgi:maltose alpha-D-glucosyltransferase/alpha-amylase